MSDRVTSFFLLHGTIVWVSALAAFVITVFVAIDRVRRARARRWVRGEASSLDLPTSDRVIRGILEGGDASTTTRRGEAVHARTADLSIVTADGQIPLVGELHIVAGSTMIAERAATRCELRAGDEVVVHGTLERTATRDELDYRANPTTFALRGAPLLAAAKNPASAVARLSLRAMVLIALATTTFGYEVEHALGQIWRDRCDPRSSLGTCALAAAMPGNRDMPEHVLALLDHDRRTSADLDRQVWLALVLDDCDAAMRPLEQTRDWRRLAALARQCEAPSREQRALVQLGYFAEAAKLDLPYGKYRSGTAAILAQDWKLAAAQLARTVAPLGGTVNQRCAIELFNMWAGDPGAGQRLRALAQTTESPSDNCEAAVQDITGDSRLWQRIGYSTALEEVHALASSFDDNAAVWWASRIWVSEYAPAGEIDSYDSLAIHDARAIHRMMRGDTAGALADATNLDQSAAGTMGTLPVRAPLARQLSLFTPGVASTDLPPNMSSWWHQLAHVFLRAGKPFAANLDVTTAGVLQEAQEGDGRPLARTIAAGASPLRDFDLLSVLPRVTLGRGALVEAIRMNDRIDHGDDIVPWAVATHAFVRRSLFELAGDHDAATAWNGVFARYDAALSNKRVQLALLLAR